MALAVMDDFTFVAWMDTEQFGGVACILYCSRIAELNARGMFVNANQLEQHCFVYLWRNRIISSYMYIVSDRRSKTAQKCVHSFLVFKSSLSQHSFYKCSTNHVQESKRWWWYSQMWKCLWLAAIEQNNPQLSGSQDAGQGLTQHWGNLIQPIYIIF